jgi:hypothetical protein
MTSSALPWTSRSTKPRRKRKGWGSGPRRRATATRHTESAKGGDKPRAGTVLAAIAYNLTRAAGVLASAFHAKATTATIRTQLIAVPARIARSARRSCLHLPAHWPWQDPWTALHAAATGPPATATT